MSESAEHLRSALSGTNLEEAVDRLPWLCPGVAALITLGRSTTPDRWRALRNDPGAVLLVVRQSGSSRAEQLDSPALLDEVLQRLDGATLGNVDWDAPAIRAILQTGLVCAAFAEALARKLERVDPETAWTCGLLAPLGWYVATALDPDAAAACLADPMLADNPVETERRHWGIDAAALARRVIRRWHVPPAVGNIVGYLTLPPETAVALGADPILFRVTRLAVGLARDQGFDLGLTAENNAADIAALGLSAEDVNRLDVPTPLPAPSSQNPRQVPLLRDLLVVAAENRHLRERALRRRIEADADRLLELLEQQADSTAERLRTDKLAALAEFAAGAGHEINNPLAVISGQAQYVLAHGARWFSAEAGDGPHKSLQAVITQTKRIHCLLRDLMQFARPSAPRPVWFELSELLTETAASLHDLADQRHVRLEIDSGPLKVRVRADRDQVKAALANLLRNAVEAAPAEGWARLALHAPAGSRVEITVEDNGAGPDETQRAHLFDPFYSGRSAGRGRGLGLSTAWRLAGLQGGDIYFDPTPLGTPTRFVLVLPWSLPPEPELCLTVAAPVFTETVGINGIVLDGCLLGKG